ncbi:MAG: response regulator [Bacteroidota bacterium]
MEKIYMICIDDQPTVLDAVISDLEVFSDSFEIEACESASEAEELMEEVDQNGDHVAILICDQVMPGKSGTEFLAEVRKQDTFKSTGKILLTGQATHQDTINAINQADIDKYIEKPWQKDTLIGYIKILLTRFLLDKGIDHMQYKDFLDQETLLEKFKGSV